MTAKKAPAKKAAAKPKPPAPPAPEPAPPTSSRPYTGFDGYAKGRLPGTELLVGVIQYLTEGKVWNNGTFGIRLMRGKPLPSIHGTGRAADLSWRDMRDGRRGDGATRADGVRIADWLVRHADLLGVELVLDYWPAPFGRGWRCDRQEWSNYTRATIAGAPGGDWLHVEISPAMARDGEAMRKAIEQALRLDA